MAWETPKTDWTKQDYYNYGDLNRVESNITELKTLLETYFSSPSTGTIKTDWDNSDICRYDALNRIESNVDAIRDIVGTPGSNWSEPVTDWASLDIFKHTDAIRIELNMLSLYTMIDLIVQAFKKCGTFYCGEELDIGGVS